MPIDSPGVSPQRVRVRRTAAVALIESMAGRGRKWHKVPGSPGWKDFGDLARASSATPAALQMLLMQGRAGHSQHV